MENEEEEDYSLLRLPIKELKEQIFSEITQKKQAEA